MALSNMPAYPITYQRETSPAWLHYAAVLNGARGRDPKTAFRYLELGCGRGYSTLVHAACFPQGTFVGVDSDESAIADAQGWAQALGLTNVRFAVARFDDAALLDDDAFDFVALHGVYSWVTEESRAAIRALLADKLADGGLAYVSYNAMPGWASELPLRRLLGELSSGESIADAARTIDGLRGFGFFKAHPSAERAVASWQGKPEGYLAHEYLAEACEPLWSVDVTDAMAAAGLSWAGSATLRDAHEALLIDEATAAAVAAMPTARQRTLAMDFAVNRAFRRDVFVKGARGEGSDVREIVVSAADEITDSVVMPRGRVRFQPAFIAALRALMAKGPVRLGDAVVRLANGQTAPDVARNLLWLVAAGMLSPLGEAAAREAQAREALRRLGVVPSA